MGLSNKWHKNKINLEIKKVKPTLTHSKNALKSK